MSTPRFGALVGLALGAIWGVAGFGAAVLAGFLAAGGYVTVLVVEGRVDLTRFVGHQHATEPTRSAPTTERTRTNLQ